MNYYERHLGDYAKDTGHLTMLEHGAYTLLLDRYYSTEHGIPADQVYRVARARSKDEREAVDIVLQEFFVLEEETWINGRAEEEVAKVQSKVNIARENGKRGGRPKKATGSENETQEKPSGFSSGSENETQEKAHQSPVTSHQSPEENTHCSTAEGVARVPVPAESESSSHQPTTAGLICRAMKSAGIADPNPGHPDLLALIAAGATEAEFIGAARTAASRSKGFAYAIGTLKRQRLDAAKDSKAMHSGEMPRKSDTLTAGNIAAAQRFLARSTT